MFFNNNNTNNDNNNDNNKNSEPSVWDNDGALTELERYALIERGIVFGVSAVWFIIVLILQLVRRKHHPLRARSLFLTIVQPIITIPFIYGMTLNFYITPCPLQVYIKMVSTPLLFTLMFCRCFYLFSLFQITKVRGRIARFAPKRANNNNNNKNKNKNNNSNNPSLSTILSPSIDNIADSNHIVDFETNNPNLNSNSNSNSTSSPGSSRSSSSSSSGVITIFIPNNDNDNNNNNDDKKHNRINSNISGETNTETPDSKPPTPTSATTKTKTKTKTTSQQQESSSSKNSNKLCHTSSAFDLDPKKTMRQFRAWEFANSIMLMLLIGGTAAVASIASFINIALHAEANPASSSNGYPYWRSKKCIEENIDTLGCIVVMVAIWLVAVAVIAFMIRKIRDGFNITREIAIEITLCGICLCAFVLHVILGIVFPPGRTVTAFFSSAIWGILAVHIIVINSGLIPVIRSYQWERQARAGAGGGGGGGGGRNDAVHHHYWTKAEDMETSLQSMLQNAAMRKLFRAYCEKEFSVENFLFWKEVEAWKTIMNDREEQRLRAKELYAQYIDNRGPLVLNITDELRNQVLRKIEAGEITPSLFDEVQHSALVVMCDTYNRFRNTKEYRKELDERRRQEEALEKVGFNVL